MLLGKTYDPYFPRHVERDIYISLLQKTDPPAPEALLKAALVRRAMTDVTRILRMREDKPVLQNLLQKGSVGDDLWNSLLAAEKELEAEILETAAEANSFVEGWGSVIFQTATEMIHNEKLRALLEQVPAMRAEKGASLERHVRVIRHSIGSYICAERKYGITSTKAIEAPVQTPEVVVTPSASPAPSSPPPTKTPLSPKSTNGLSSLPTSASVESGVSDNEGSVSSPASRSGKSVRLVAPSIFRCSLLT